jgi:hypothetical protein
MRHLFRNRRIIAEYLGWPEGVVEACEQLDRAHIGWSATWSDGDSQAKPKVGFYAERQGRRTGEPMAYGATPEELSAVIATWPWPKD